MSENVKDVLFELTCKKCDGAISLNGKTVENMVAEVECKFCGTNYLYVPLDDAKDDKPVVVGGIVAGTINAKNIVHGNMTVYGDYVGRDKTTVLVN